MPVDAITALIGLDDTLDLKRGESIMIFGASGGIGHLAVQLAKRMGARVFAVASGSDGVAMVQTAGRRCGRGRTRGRSFSRPPEASRRSGIDAALVTAGGKEANASLRPSAKAGALHFPPASIPSPSRRAGVAVNRYDGMPTAKTIQKLNRADRGRAVRGPRGQSIPAGPGGRRATRAQEHYLGKLALRPN